MIRSKHLLAGFADEFSKLAAQKKRKKVGLEKSKYQKDKLGDPPYRPGSRLSVTDDPYGIAPAYDRDGANAQHHSIGAQNSENDTGQYT